MKRFLLRKSVVLGLIILLAACFTAGNIFPGIRVLASWWFGVVFLVFVLSLILSTGDQYRIARAKIHASPGTAGNSEPLAVPVEAFEQHLKLEGYRKLASSEDAVRFGKGAWGYWGNFILHLGMIVTVLSSGLYVATEHRMIVRAVAGVRIDPAAGENAERRGLMSAPLRLPRELVVERIEPTFWDNGQLKTLSSELVFFDDHGGQERVSIGVSDKTIYRGMKVYQQNEVGAVFLIELRDTTHDFRMALHMPLPPKKGVPAYGNFDIENGRYKLKAKYVSDIAGRDVLPTNPLLTLRLYEGDTMKEERSFRLNGRGSLGPYTVHLADMRLWTNLLFDGSRGIAGIFTGFFLLLLGGGLGYFVIPREVVLSGTADGYSTSWRAAKFPDFFREEGERILSVAREKADPVTRSQ